MSTATPGNFGGLHLLSVLELSALFPMGHYCATNLELQSQNALINVIVTVFLTATLVLS